MAGATCITEEELQVIGQRIQSLRALVDETSRWKVAELRIAAEERGRA